MNDLIVASDTSVVANYDADCILPKESYRQAYDMIHNNEADVVYPYGCGIYQWKAQFNMEIYEEFVKSWNGTSVLDKKTLSNSTIGWTQFIRRENYINSYMMNENFVSWGCEDDEFYFPHEHIGQSHCQN